MIKDVIIRDLPLAREDYQIIGMSRLIQELLNLAFGPVAKVFDQLGNCLRDFSLSSGARTGLSGQERCGIGRIWSDP